jgi:hydrogenase maturation protein HypF
MELVRKQVNAGINTPLTSSMGRLFDAISAMCGIRSTINYEAQAAIEMESRAYEAPDERGAYPFTVAGDGGYHIIKLADLLAAVTGDLAKGCSIPTIAMKFHNTVAAMARDVSLQIQRETGIGTVALSGGCFQNRLLLMKTLELLRSAGFRVLTHRQSPTNDGGISLGQAVIAAKAGL